MINIRDLNDIIEINIYFLLLQIKIILLIVKYKYIFIIDVIKYFYQFNMKRFNYFKFIIINYRNLKKSNVVFINYKKLLFYI